MFDTEVFWGTLATFAGAAGLLVVIGAFIYLTASLSVRLEKRWGWMGIVAAICLVIVLIAVIGGFVVPIINNF